MMTAFGCLTANAQIIYSNSFPGASGALNGTAPTVANSLAGGVNSALWTCTYTNGVDGTVLANGTLATNSGNALLPFAPQPGAVYTMTASLTVPASMSDWVAMGFTQFNTQTNNPGYARFTDTPPNGYAWMSARTGIADQLFGGPRTSDAATPTSIALPGAGTYTLQIILNTVGAHWTVSAFVNGSQLGTNIVYNTNPTIEFAGIGQNQFQAGTAGIQWNYWALTVAQAPATTTGYWVAPTASGAGDGSSPFNPASYLNSSFWSTVQNQLQSANVNVSFLSGAYNAGTLSFTNAGNPLHQLALSASIPHGPVFSPSANILQLYGCQNFQVNGLVFNGPTPYWGIYCIPNNFDPCRNIQITNCWFLNLTNAYYAAIGLLNGTRDVQVSSCTFTNITNGSHEHMIYAPHDIVDIVVSNCVFQDCLADYVRFRDDSEYNVVKNCTFISTESACAWPFVSAEQYNETNSDSAGDEFFGTYFQVSSNSFIYKATGGPGPYSALHFSDTGWSPDTYYCDLTSAQASQLGSGSVSYQQAFLQTNMGIIASDIKMSGNTYSGATYHMDYAYSWDGTSPYNNWEGTIGLNNVPDSSGAPMAPVPVLRNGNFDRQGFLVAPVNQGLDDYECYFRNWLCSPKYTDILWSPGFSGTSNALRFDRTTSQRVYQWIASPGQTWTMDCLFAIGSAFTGTGTKFQADLFHNDITGAKVSLGVDNLGRFGIYNGGSFTLLPGLGTVAFSVDANGDGNYTEPGDTLNVYRLRIVGNYATGTPYVNIYTSDANSMNLDHQALGQTAWVVSSPVGGQSVPCTVAFYNFTAPVLLDQVSIASGLGEQPPVISNVYDANGQIILSGTNGFQGDTYYLLSSTNLASPNWTLDSTSTFGTNGLFSVTNSPAPGAPQEFYRLELQ
jgi:hypothetical protein